MKENWTYKKMGDLISPARVVRNEDSENYPILSITMREGIILQADRFKKVIASVDTSSYKVVENGQLVIAFPIDEGLIYTQDVVDKGIMSPAYNIWNVDYSEMNRRFLVKYLHGPYAMKYYKSKLRGTTMRRRSIPKSDLLALTIPVPPVEEQERIVEELDLLSGIIENQKQQLKELDTLAQSIFYDTFGDPITNEKNWPVKKLGDECNEIKYGTSKPACEGGRYGYLRMCNISYTGELDLNNLKRIDLDNSEFEKYSVKYGDILFNRTNSIDLIGKTCMYCLKEPMIIAGYIIRVRLKDGLNPVYVSKMFNIPSFKILFKSKAKGAVNQANINSKELASLNIPLPPLSLQEEFAEKIEMIEKQKEAIGKSIKETQLLFDYTMDKHFG